MQNNPPPAAAPFAALIGIDWADQKHAVCLYDAQTGKTEHSELPQTPEAIAVWAAALQERFGGRPVAVCLEQSKGALIYALMAYAFPVLYPVNPATSPHYRHAFKTSRAKSDPGDAEICMELLLQHRDKLTAWHPDDVETRTMRQLIEKRRATVNLRTDLSNSLRTELKTCFPRALELLGEESRFRQTFYREISP